MLRNSKFDTEEIEREKGVIIEEMNMYFDTPRDFIGGVYEELLYGDQPLGWDIIGTQGDGPRRDARDVPRLPRPLVQAGADGRRRSAARLGDDLARRRSSELLGDLEAQRRPARRAGVELERDAARRCTIHHKDVRPGAPLPRRAAATRSTHPDRYALQLLSTVLGTGMSSRLFTEVRERRGLAYYVFAHNQQLHRRRLALLAGRRRHQPRSTRRSRRSSRELRKIADEPCRPTSSRRRARSPRDASCSRLESPHGLIMFGLRREVLEGAGDRAGGDPRRARRGHGRGRAAGRAGRDRLGTG